MDSCIISSPLGNIQLEYGDIGLVSLRFLDENNIETSIPSSLKETVKQLDEYFNKQREHFDIPLELIGSPFQLKVWNYVATMSYNQVFSYKQLAEKLDISRASRAIGGALNKNKIPIIIPCHRIVGSNGALVGYSGGIDKKKWLLDFESDF